MLSEVDPKDIVFKLETLYWFPKINIAQHSGPGEKCAGAIALRIAYYDNHA